MEPKNISSSSINNYSYKFLFDEMTNSVSKTCFVEFMPDELLLKIFEYVTGRNLLAVNKRFYNIGWETKASKVALQKMLQKACEKQEKHSLAMIRKILKSKNSSSLNFTLPFNIAAANNHIKAIKELLKDNRVDPPLDSIRVAFYRGHLKVIKEILNDEKFDPSAEANLAIRLASIYGQERIVKRLLKDTRVDPSDCENCAIHVARQKGHIKIVAMLLKDRRVVSHIQQVISWSACL